MNWLLFDDLLEEVSYNSLVDFILRIVYTKPVEYGDRSMFGLVDDCVFVEEDQEDKLTIFDSTGELLVCLDDNGNVNDFKYTYYLKNKVSLERLCEQVQIIINASKVIFI